MGRLLGSRLSCELLSFDWGGTRSRNCRSQSSSALTLPSAGLLGKSVGTPSMHAEVNHRAWVLAKHSCATQMTSLTGSSAYLIYKGVDAIPPVLFHSAMAGVLL